MSETTAPAKKATNLSLSADTLADARALGINLSQACDQFLRDLVRRERARRWLADHGDFITAYNRCVEEEGLPLDSLRGF